MPTKIEKEVPPNDVAKQAKITRSAGKLIALIESQSLSRSEVGAKLGVHPTTIGAYVSSSRVPVAVDMACELLLVQAITVVPRFGLIMMPSEAVANIEWVIGQASGKVTWVEPD